jgi:uncharacterized protein YpbB
MKEKNWSKWNLETKESSLTLTEKEIYENFKKNQDINRLSKNLNLKLETVEKHIINLITKSFISIYDILEKEKVKKIIKIIKKNYLNKTLTELKELIEKNQNEEIHWFELKLLIAHLNSKPKRFKKKQKQN